jgi:membrane protease YdiL (CAAX protease family)
MAGSAVLFAVVHVGVYGVWVLPLDVAAGLVLGWQRWATGSWAVPAATHVVANLVMVI